MIGEGVPGISEQVRALTERYAGEDRSAALALLALVRLADDNGSASFHDVALGLRSDYLAAVRAEGRDADAEAGRLSLDEVRFHLANVVVPRLVGSGAIDAVSGDSAHARLRIAPPLWSTARMLRGQVAQALRETGEFTAAPRRVAAAPKVEGHSVLSAEGLVKSYRRRNVVNDVSVNVKQGEIVGLLGPNGAGKTTTFYMIVGLIPPQQGRILFDKEDITGMPTYRRAWRGILRDKGAAGGRKRPALLVEVRKMLATLGDDLAGARDRALILFGLAGAMRRSELVSLNVGDIELVDEGFVVRIRRSKTDQTGKGHKIGIPYGKHRETCHVRSMLAWLKASRIERGAIFRKVNRHGDIEGERLCGYSIALIVKRSLKAAGINPRHFAGHSAFP